MEIAPGKTNISPIKHSAMKAMSLYADAASPSNISGDFDTFMQGKGKKMYPGRYAKLLTYLYNKYKGYMQNPNKQPILDQIELISKTAVNEPFTLLEPTTGEILDTLFTPEEKYVAMHLLKYICGIVKQKTKVTRATHSPAYVEAHNKTIKKLDRKEFSSEELEQILQQLA
jgi:hypothetical protein